MTCGTFEQRAKGTFKLISGPRNCISNQLSSPRPSTRQHPLCVAFRLSWTPWTRTKTNSLDRVFEACLRALDLHLTTIDLFVVPLELDCKDYDNNDDDQLRGDACPQAGAIGRRVLFPKHEGLVMVSDASDTTESDQSCRTESTLPMTTTVVCLIRHARWDVRVGLFRCVSHWIYSYAPFLDLRPCRQGRLQNIVRQHCRPSP